MSCPDMGSSTADSLAGNTPEVGFIRDRLILCVGHGLQLLVLSRGGQRRDSSKWLQFLPRSIGEGMEWVRFDR